MAVHFGWVLGFQIIYDVGEHFTVCGLFDG